MYSSDCTEYRKDRDWRAKIGPIDTNIMIVVER
jgi:hypothetical protein